MAKRLTVLSQHWVETLVGSLLIVFSLIEHDCKHIVLHNDFMVTSSALTSGMSDLGLSPGWKHCIVFLAIA